MGGCITLSIWIWINMQKLLIKIGILFSPGKKKSLSIFSNCDEGKIMILNPNKKREPHCTHEAVLRLVYLY